MIETNIVSFESCTLKEIRRMDGSTSSSSSSPYSVSSSQLTREQQVLLNFDEVVALWYLIIALWYGYFRYRNSRFAIIQLPNRHDSANSIAQCEFSPIHWLILCIAIMGLANFLFSLSLLEVMDHRSSIGSSVLKLSYINMIIACLRHPCTLSLGVLAPKVTFGYDRYYYFPSESAARAEGTKSTTVCLVALVFAQLVLRLMENLMVLFCYGGRRKSETVKLVDFFEYVMDGVFLVQMVQSLYKITLEISRDRGGTFGFNRWQAWWKSRSLLFYWILYTIFVAVSTVLVLIGVSAFFDASVFGNQHFVYTNYKVHAVNDMLLLTGIAVVLRPKPIGHFQRLENDSVEGDAEIDYRLLRAESNEEEGHIDEGDDHEEEGESIFEMTTAAFATNNCESNSTPTTRNVI